MLLVDHDEAEVLQRREHRRARADHDLHAARADVLPLVVPLARREMAVQHGHARLLPGKAGAKALHRLRRQRDLRHQHQRGAARRHHLRDRLQIDLRLAAAGHAVQQDHARLQRRPFVDDGPKRRLLLGVHLERRRRRPPARAGRDRGPASAARSGPGCARPTHARRPAWRSRPARKASPGRSPRDAARRAPAPCFSSAPPPPPPAIPRPAPRPRAAA